MNEALVERRLLWVIARMGGTTWKFTAPGRKGVADRVVCLPDGSTWFVELKAPKGKLSALQVLFAAEMKRLGQRYACISTVEQADAFEALSKQGSGVPLPA